MSKQSNPNQSTQVAATKASPHWGVSAHEFYRTLADKPVKITALDGKLYAGTLIGVDQYDIVIRQANGLIILFPKHSVKYLHADSVNPATPSA